MSQHTPHLSSPTAYTVRDRGRFKGGPMGSAILTSIGGWMLIIAALAILLAVEIQLTRGWVTAFLISTFLLTLPSHRHLRLALGRGVKAKSNPSAKHTVVNPSASLPKGVG
jgi:hypothetical protein